uniref:GOLD domain-containing protein n=1 Tax=Lotharella globosa TaxID=91324 RepID=A0A7S3Y9H6_9EUKA
MVSVPQKVELKFDIGEHAANYDDMAKSEHLSAIELEVRKLVDIVRDIRSQQQYLREREVSFRDISDSTNSSVMWWSFLQTIVLIGSGAWQVYQLKTIFNAKKWD